MELFAWPSKPRTVTLQRYRRACTTSGYHNVGNTLFISPATLKPYAFGMKASAFCPKPLRSSAISANLFHANVTQGPIDDHVGIVKCPDKQSRPMEGGARNYE
jgi:hypothetical protein